MTDELVSIIMLSHDKGKYVKETIESVLGQTYQNWELVFMDDWSRDDTLSQMMVFQEKDDRFKISQSVRTRGSAVSMNSALRDAKGRWIAFLNVGDLWEPTKLERQIAFMKENGYYFSYTKFGLVNMKSEDRGAVIGGKAHITYKDMQKCCWPCYLTVMYDARKVGKMQVRNLGRHNDYALWLNVCEKVDCHLLPENLGRLRTPWGVMGKLFATDKIKWRYEVYRVEEDLSPLVSALFTIRNMVFGLWKWLRYVKR